MSGRAMAGDPTPVLLAALAAARHGTPPDAALAGRIARGDLDVALEDLRFDSLAVMEFCIAVELETGAELTPDLMAGMARLSDVAAWIAAQDDPALS